MSSVKFWACFAGLLPFFFVLAVATLVLVLFDGMRRDLLRGRAQMLARWAGARTKREGNKMLITGLTPRPQPRRCMACGVPEGGRHERGCVMLLAVEAPPAGAAATGLDVFQEIDEAAQQMVADQELHRRLQFDTELQLFCRERHVHLIEAERRALYEVEQAGRVELQVIRRTASWSATRVRQDVLFAAAAVSWKAWNGWRREGGPV